MITTRLTGGLGNQMFQYAAGRRLAIQNKTQLILDLSHYERFIDRQYELGCFKLSPEVVLGSRPPAYYDFNLGTNLSMTFKQYAKKYIGKARLVVEHGYFFDDFVGYVGKKDMSVGKFDSTILKTKGNAYLIGLWQSEKYFAEYTDKIRQDLSFKYKAAGQNSNLLKTLSRQQSVSLHVRRTDYVTYPHSETMELLDRTYYQKAIEIITEKVKRPYFYIFSDDPVWCKKNLELGKNVSVVHHNLPDKGFEDMRLMMSCKHHIIANSSFSWWGAWLNPRPDKIVVAPKRWYKPKMLLNSSDIVPETWIKI